jgi:pimeloyl-ACP methyl ester carboxylesterase
MISLTVTASLLVSLASAIPTFAPSRSFRARSSFSNDTVSSFEDIPSSANLTWTPCYKRFQCANLEVPLDYENPSLGAIVTAWIRLNAANSSGTDVLFNPGGPGGSGINYFLNGGADKIIGSTGGRYNAVSFDPRGVNASGIELTCFPGRSDIRESFTVGKQVTDEEKYAEAVGYGKWCTEANKNTTAHYAGTVAVVQDMMHFTELQATLNGKKAEDALIWYYGVSYGTVIGHTLASLYPDRIGRIIVDANVDSDNYYNGNSDNSVATADDGVKYFFDVCAEAGEKKCPFASNSSSADDLEKRFNNLLDDLEKNPIQSISPALEVPMIITQERVLQSIHNWLYTPTQSFAIMAFGLAGLEKGNASAWIEAEQAGSSVTDPGPFNYTDAAQTEALHFVTAIDAAGRYSIKDVDEYLVQVQKISNTSEYFGSWYAGLNPLLNAGMAVLPPTSQKFEGMSSHSNYVRNSTNQARIGFKKTKTATPILFVNTLGDPITPIAGAKHMSTFFEGSVVVTQNSGGHGVTNVPSSCTLGHMLNYLDTGKVPEDGIVCETDKKPLVDHVSKRGLEVPAKNIARRRI